MRANSDSSPTWARLRDLIDHPLPRSALAPRFGLLVPPSPFVVPTGWEFVHTAPFEGPSIIAGLVQALGLPFTMIDQRELPDPASLLASTLDPIDILGIATYEDSFPYQREVIRIAREHRKDRPIILGGPLVTSLPELMLRETQADYAVVGEGELTLIELLDHLMGRPGAPHPRDIAGLAWRDPDGRVVQNPRRPQMWDLDAVPFQDLAVWPSVQKTGRSTEIYFQATRGCPMSCSFCFRAMPALAHKSPARIHAELQALKRFEFEFAWWNDLTFIAERDRTLQVLQAMKGIDFRWSCFTHAVGVDAEICRIMRDRGCDIVMYGFESITQSILDEYGKRSTPSQILNAIESAREAGLKVGGLFIIGAPGETRESIRNLVEFCERFEEVTRVKYLSALPGTPLYRQALRDGHIRDEVEHLLFLARERSVEEDEFLNLCGLPEQLLRETYHKVNGRIQVRPYEWRNPKNRYLAEPVAFSGRPVPKGSDPRP